MAAIKLSQLYGGGQFKPSFFSGLLSHNLSSASPLAISPAAGKVLRLDALLASSPKPNVSVQSGSVTIVSNLRLPTANSMTVGDFMISSVGVNGGANIEPIIADVQDDTITISTTEAASTTIYYAYSYGE